MAEAPKNTAVATKPTAVKPDWNKPTNAQGLEQLAPIIASQIERGLPSFMAGQSQRLIRCLFTECNKNPSLFNCSPISLFAGTIQAAQLGLEIGGPRGEAYLVPYGSEASLQIGYKGFLQLGYRSMMIKRCTPVEVREGDLYVVKRGIEQTIIHEPKRNNKGKVTDFYCVVELVNGGLDFEEMTVEEATAWRDRYVRAKKGPWFEAWDGNNPSNGFCEMAKKTLIRKLYKRMPLSAEAQYAAGLDEMAEHQISQQLATVHLAELEPAVSAVGKLEERLEGPATDTGTAQSPPPPPPPPPAAAKKASAKSPPPPPQPAPEPSEDADDPPEASNSGPSESPPEPKRGRAAPKTAIGQALYRLEAAGGDAGQWLAEMQYDSLDQLEQEASDQRKKRLLKNLEDKISSLDVGKQGTLVDQDEPHGMGALRG